MDNDIVQSEVLKAIADKSANIEFSKKTKKATLTVRADSPLIPLLDQFFNSGLIDMVEAAQKHPGNATPYITIENHNLEPSLSRPEKIPKDGYYLYIFDYTPLG